MNNREYLEKLVEIFGNENEYTLEEKQELLNVLLNIDQLQDTELTNEKLINIILNKNL